MRILMKRVPRKTVKKEQYRIMRIWSNAIVKAYAQEQNMKVFSKKELSDIKKPNQSLIRE